MHKPTVTWNTTGHATLSHRSHQQRIFIISLSSRPINFPNLLSDHVKKLWYQDSKWQSKQLLHKKSLLYLIQMLYYMMEGKALFGLWIPPNFKVLLKELFAFFQLRMRDKRLQFLICTAMHTNCQWHLWPSSSLEHLKFCQFWLK